MSSVVEGLAITIRSLPREEKARLIEDLLRDPDSMEAMGNVIIDRLFGERGKNEPPVFSELRTQSAGESGITSKEKARRLRSSYLAGLQERGVPVEQTGNAWAHMASGLWIALPLATEQRKNHFLLGISEEGFRKKAPDGLMAFILLCETGDGDLLDFIIPPSVVRDLAGKLSRSHGQLKLNLKRVGANYFLVVPGQAGLNVTAYRSNTAVLESPADQRAAHIARNKGR